MVRTLLLGGADADAAGELGITALMVACMANKVDIARLLIGHGADVNAVPRGTTSLLLTACGFGFTGMARLLIDTGAHVNAASAQEGKTALIWLRPILGTTS